MKINYEKFNNISTLLETLESRENNKFMKRENSSHSGRFDFTGTESYEEAVKLLVDGWEEKIPEIKELVRQKSKIRIGRLNIDKTTPKNQVIGYVPNVPNAIRNLPNSMVNIPREPIKQKTIEIVYAMTASCGVDSKEIMEAGVALVAAINLIERAGIQTRLWLCFDSSQEGEEVNCPMLLLKNFGQRFNLTKISFPMAHTSMFRRIGFKWVETTPNATEDFSCGYGRVPSLETLKKAYKETLPNSKAMIINTPWIMENDNSIEKILEYFKII